MTLRRWQAKYLVGIGLILPVAPFLYLQGRITRWKVGRLPDAAGPLTGVSGNGDAPPVKMLAIGESTVAGVGARDHERALAGQFASRLNERIRRPVEWTVVGKSGVTARRAIDELVPRIPDAAFDYILVGLGGNDVMRLTSPRRWRRDMTELLGILKERNPDATVFLSNCPMIVMSPVIPEPAKSILWNLSQMHDRNMREIAASLDRVHYYPQPARVTLDGFFADGIHPSEQGYRDWARAMMEHFDREVTWTTDRNTSGNECA